MEYYSIVLQCNSAIVAMALHTFLKLQDKFTIWWHIREKFFPQHHHLHKIHEVSETHLHGIHVNALFHLREIHEIPMPHLHEIALLLWSRTKCVIACLRWRSGKESRTQRRVQEGRPTDSAARLDIWRRTV